MSAKRKRLEEGEGDDEGGRNYEEVEDDDVDDIEIDDEEVDDDDDEDDDEEIEDDPMMNSSVEIEFEALDATDEDEDGIKRLLRQLWLKENVNVTQLTQLLLNQKQLTSVIKVNFIYFAN